MARRGEGPGGDPDATVGDRQRRARGRGRRSCPASRCRGRSGPGPPSTRRPPRPNRRGRRWRWARRRRRTSCVCPVATVIRVTLWESSSATQTSSPTRTMPRGPLPTRIGEVIWSPVRASMRITEPDRPLATQTEVSSTARPSGPSSTSMGSLGVPLVVSMRWMVLSPLLATHSPAGPAAMASGSLPTSMVLHLAGRPATLMRETVPSAKLVTHRSSPVSDQGTRVVTDVERLRDRVRRRVDLRDGVVAGVDDPDRVPAGGQCDRVGADGDGRHDRPGLVELGDGVGGHGCGCPAGRGPGSPSRRQAPRRPPWS